MISQQESRGFAEFLKVYSELKPLLDSPEKMAAVISGVENAQDTVKRGEEAAVKLEELRISKQKNDDAAATIARATQILTQSQKLLDDGLANLGAERAELEKNKQDYAASVSAYNLLNKSITDRETKVAELEKSLDEQFASVAAQKDDYANKLSLLNKLNGGK